MCAAANLSLFVIRQAGQFRRGSSIYKLTKHNSLEEKLKT
jgi:hypothetical protein